MEPAARAALAQRLSDRAELEMMMIRESMARVNESLRATRAVYLRRPSLLRALSSTLRTEAAVQEKCAAQAVELIWKMGEMRESMAAGRGDNGWSQLGASLAMRMSDLQSGLESRRAAMAAASSAPERWMKECRRRRAERRGAFVRRTERLWKAFALLAVVVFAPSLFSPAPLAFAFTLSSGALVLCAALLVTAQDYGRARWCRSR